MNILFSSIGKRGYIAEFFRPHLQSGDRLIATSSTPWTPGFRSVDKAIIMPPYKSDGYRQAVLDICSRERVSAILSFMDEDVAILAEFENELRQIGVTPILPPVGVARMCLDKWQFYSFCRNHQLRTAKTYIDLGDAEIAIAEGSLEFPLFVKPRFGFGSANTWLARDNAELRVFFNYQESMLIQETLKGDAYNIEILNDLESNPLLVVPWRKFQSRLGETEQAVTVDDPELVEFGYKLGGLTAHVGPMDVDLFVCDGAVSVLELNPRFGGGYPVSHFAGADFPGLIMAMLRGENPRPLQKKIKVGVAMMKEVRPFGGAWQEIRAKDLKLV